MYYDNLFKLCGFDDEQIKQDAPRIEKTFKNWGITEEDVHRAEARIQKYYATQFEGVRKLIGVWMKEFMCLTLAREECRKVVYSEWPGSANILLMGMNRAAPDCYFGSPTSQTVNMVMGSFFDKLTPILEAGEENGMTPGRAHCALWLTHTGIIAKGLVPKPDLIVSAGWLCDIAGECDAMIEAQFGVPTVFMDGCIDWQNDDFPWIGDKQVKYAGAQLRKVKERIEEVIGIEVDDETLNAGNSDMGKLFFNYQTLLQLVGKADPLPISMTNLDLAYAMFYTPLKYRSEADEAIMTLVKEVKPLVDRGEGFLPKGAPKVYVVARNYVDPSITWMIQECGLNPCVMMADYLLPTCMSRILEAGRTDPCELMTEGVYRIGQLVVQGSGPADYIPNCCKDFNVDGCIINYPFNCRLISVIFGLKKPLQEAGILTLTMEADEYDTRQYSAASMRTRVEAFAEMLKMKKAGLLVGS
jgi:hypothetical protein